MSKSVKSVPATAKVVRSYFREHPEQLPEDASAVLRDGVRGRVHPSAVKVFNEVSGMTYTEGTRETITVPYTVKNAKGANLKRSVELPVDAARLLAGDLAGKRGRLSAAALAGAGEAYAESL